MTKHLTPKDKILQERGLILVKPSRKGRKRLAPAIRATHPDKPKTALMKYLEQKYGVAVEEVLVSGSLSVVAKRLGNEVDETTISKWIKRFKLRYSADNLPDCHGCKHYGPACEAGICYVLLDLGLYELVPLKKKEVLNEGN